MLEPQVFYSVELQCFSAPDFGRAMRLSTSLDGQTFSEVRSNIVGEQDLKITLPGPQYARYFRVELLESAGAGWWRIDDLFVLQ